MENILLGILGGAFGTLLNWGLMQTLVVLGFKRFYRRISKKNPEKALRKLTDIFSPSFAHKAFLATTVSLSLPVLGVWAFLPTLSALPAAILSLVIGSGIAWFVVGKDEVSKMRVKAALAAIELYTEDRPTQPLLPFLTQVIHHSDSVTRLAAVEALGFLHHPESLPLLEAALEDPAENVQVAAEIHYETVLKLSRKKSLFGVAIMEELIRYAGELKEKEFEFGSYHLHRQAEKRETVENTLKAILEEQKHLRNLYPNMLCVHCRTRTRLVRKAEWEYLRCRKCNSLNGIATGIREVVGVIGETYSWQPQEGVLSLGLWDESGKKARFADIDRLVIRGGKPLNYDWAINAVIEVLQNGAPEADWKVPIAFEEKPELTPNTELLIEQIIQQEVEEL